MADANNHHKKSQTARQAFLTVAVIAIVTLGMALYKINRHQERFESKRTATEQNVTVKREQVMDKYVNDYADGAAWALKNEVIEPEQCDEATTTSVGNLGCVAAATELRDDVSKVLARELARSELENELEEETIPPEDAIYNEAYLEPEAN